ncbi:MAG: Mur ligase domain-containing protein, partial [Martelella sp.]
MKLSALAGTAFPELNAALAGSAGALEIASLTADSRKAGPGGLFVAIAGSKADGSAFIDDAAARGAVAAI